MVMLKMVLRICCVYWSWGQWIQCVLFFFFNDPATTDIYTLSLHDALPICQSYFKIKVIWNPRFHSATWNIWHYYLVLSCWMLACMFFFHKFRFLTQFYFLFNGTNTWNLVCDRSRLTAMAERKPTSAYGSLVFFNEQDAVEGKGLIGLNFLWHLKLVLC